MTESRSRNFVQALALGLEPEWRRLPEQVRAEDADLFRQAVEEPADVLTFTYTSIGIRAGCDLLLWRLAPSLEELEEAAALVLRSGLGRWMRVVTSLVGIIQPSQYVKRPTPQEQSLFAGERSRYLVVYPFTKTAEWYLMGKDVRQGIMNEHIRLGHQYPQVRQLLANSFGLTDHDFLVAYETDDLAAWSNLVRDMRGIESRRWTAADSPIVAAVHRPLAEALAMLGAPFHPAAQRLAG